MLEFISSQAVAAVAVLALLGTVTGIFQVQNGALEEGHFRQMCRSVARTVDALSSVNSAISVNITFRSDCQGLHLAPSFRGRAYELEFRTGQVIFRQDGLLAANAFVRPVHLWNLSELGVSAGADFELMDQLDSEHAVLKLTSGKELVVERCPLVLSGKPVYATLFSLRVTC